MAAAMPPSCWVPRPNISLPPGPSRATARPIGPSPIRRSTSARAPPPAMPARTPCFNSRRNTVPIEIGYPTVGGSVARDAEHVAPVVEELVQDGGAGPQHGAVLHGQGVDGGEGEGEGEDEP